MAKKAANRRSTPELDLGASTTPPKQKKAAEATESAVAGLSAFNVDKREPIVQPTDPNAVMFDEYGIDGSTYDIPIILKAILCELVRRRV